MDNRSTLVDFYIRLPRQGPGSTEMTVQALDATGFDGRPDQQIVDIGCGTGTQTMVLGAHCNSQITAVDIFPEFLEKLQKRSVEAGIADRVKTLSCSMDDLPLKEGSIDLIWSEGAIYNMGFEQGLSYWRRFLKDEGLMAVSEIVWTTQYRPSALTAYWHKEYPDIATVEDNLRRIRNAGLDLIDYFILPPSCWQQNYYDHVQRTIPDLLQRHANSRETVVFTQQLKEEMAIFEAFQEYYSYAFFIVKNENVSPDHASRSITHFNAGNR